MLTFLNNCIIAKAWTVSKCLCGFMSEKDKMAMSSVRSTTAELSTCTAVQSQCQATFIWPYTILVATGFHLATDES